ncbi:MAG: hypothetical protein ABIP94_23140, partial [Planctomycetota bacterium]
MGASRQRLLLQALAHAGHRNLAVEASWFLRAEDAEVRAAAAQAIAADDSAAGQQIAREVLATTADPEVRRILARSPRRRAS